MSSRRLMTLGALLTCTGLAIAGTAPIMGTTRAERVLDQQLFGGIVVVLGWLFLAWAIHGFGRAKTE